MKTLLQTLKWVIVGIVILAVGFVIFVLARADRTYEAPYPDIAASQDSAVIAHGKALVYGPAHCAHCHAPVSDLARVEQGEEVSLRGGVDFVLPVGTLYAPNITPDEETGIGAFTDQELARSLRYGVKRNGQALVDFMPFYDLSDDDLTAIISYLRTTPPVRNERPGHDWNFLGKIVRALGAVKPMGDGVVPPAPAPDSTAEYGYYLAESIANCKGCHTRRDLMTGGWIGPVYAGQMAMEVSDEQGRIVPGKHLITPNLTPDSETGKIADWTQAVFIQRFRQGRVIAGSPMPWGPYSRMTDAELVALYKFLRTLDPVHAPTPAGIQEGDPAAN
jgi:mono/diheme cytochrome c family protein